MILMVSIHPEYRVLLLGSKYAPDMHPIAILFVRCWLNAFPMPCTGVPDTS